MDTLRSWLGALGLDRYAALFESHGIDLRSLPLLTERDLVELGVLLGHRKLLLRAIAGVPGLQAAPPAPPLPDAERRQLTVLFCDIVGSTRLAQRLDPEVLRDLMRSYQQACGSIVSRYAGHVTQYLGDGVVVYFGFPQAHEDDAERAVRAALELVAAVGSLSDITRLQVRIGIATGPVVVGRDGAEDASEPVAAVGETPNLAARLGALAEPDQVVIAPSTHRLLGSTFRIRDLGEHRLKGIEAPVRARLVRGVARSESRFDAARAGHCTPLVGRESEVALLLARWQIAREGDGQVVLLRGEPGIGKSRIAQVLRERLADTPHLRLLYQCSPYHSGTAFYPLIEQLTRACGFDRHDSPDSKLDKLEATLRLDPAKSPGVAPLFAALLSLPIDRYPARMLSPNKQKELMIAALIDQVRRVSTQQPVLMICEDAHWADPSTLETMALLIEQIRYSAVLLVITCRPEFAPPWVGQGHVTLLHLNRLARRECEAMTQQVSGAKALPPEVVAHIMERTDGVPLFVEELTLAVLEADLLRDAGEYWELKKPLRSLSIPSTLQDSLMARLDRLGPIKEVAQIGACIGREFDHELLAAVVPANAAELDDALARLIDSGLIFLHCRVPEAIYSFKHALVRDIAYDGLLKSRRLKIHGTIAHTLAYAFKDRARARPELLALHLTRAGLADEALPQWRLAARSAIANNRHQEALGYVDAGLELVERVSAESRADHEVGLLVSGAACHWVLTGYACHEAAALWARVETRLDEIKDQRLLIMALMGINICAYAGADTQKALATAERLVSLGTATTDTDTKVVAFSTVGPILHQQGQFERCTRLLEFVVDAYETDRRTGYGRLNDAKVTACNWLSYCRLAAGQLDRARQYARMAIDHATEIAQPFVLSQALSVGARSFVEAGDYAVSLELCRRCIELCDSQNIPYWKGWAMAYEGIALVRLGRFAEAETCLARALAHLSASGGRSDLGYVHAARAMALAHLDRFDEARRQIDRGHDDCVATGQLIALTDLAYARGETALLDPACDDTLAERWFSVALADARSRSLKLTELRAAMALARLWRQQGKRHEASALLAPVFSGFSEGFACQDLREAKALLDALNAPLPAG